MKQWPGLIARKTDDNLVTWVLEETAHAFYKEALDAKIQIETDNAVLKIDVADLQEDMRELNLKCRKLKEAIKNRDWGCV